MALVHQYPLVAVPLVDTYTARRLGRTTDIDGAIELARAALDNLIASGEKGFRGVATTVLVESLLLRGADGDIAEAQAAIERLAAVPTDPGTSCTNCPCVDAGTASTCPRRRGRLPGLSRSLPRHRTTLGFEGHMKWAEAMT